MSLTLGLDPNRVDASPQFGVGSFGSQADAEYIYVRSVAAISQKGAVLSIDGNNHASELTPTNDAIGNRVGIAPGPAASNNYFWALVRGEEEFYAAANCAANAMLRATSVAGVVDDAPGAGAVIEGLVAVEAAGSMQELVNGRLLYPYIQEGLATDPTTVYTESTNDTTADWREITLTKEIISGKVLVFIFQGTSTIAFGSVHTHEIVVLTTETATEPTDVTEALAVGFKRSSEGAYAANFLYIQRSDEPTKLWIKRARTEDSQLTIRLYPLGGIGSGGVKLGVTKSPVVNMSDWDLIWEQGSTETARLTTNSPTIDRDLISGKAFSDYDFIAAWIDNGTQRQGKFMYITYDLWSNVFTITDTGSGWVDWSDNSWIGIKHASDTAFRKIGGGMGIRKMYGIRNKTIVTEVTVL